MISNGTIMVWPTENVIKKLKHKATVRSCQYIDTEIYYLTGSVRVHFLEGSALLKLWNVTSDDSCHLGQCTNVLTKQFHLEILHLIWWFKELCLVFMFWQIFARQKISKWLGPQMKYTYFMNYLLTQHLLQQKLWFYYFLFQDYFLISVWPSRMWIRNISLKLLGVQTQKNLCTILWNLQSCKSSDLHPRYHCKFRYLFDEYVKKIVRKDLFEKYHHTIGLNKSFRIFFTSLYL